MVWGCVSCYAIDSWYMWKVTVNTERYAGLGFERQAAILSVYLLEDLKYFSKAKLRFAQL